MKVVSLVAENFKRLGAVEIAPDGNMVKIGGKNGSGKSSVLDAIYVALCGRAVAPPKPIRNGEEQCHLKLDLGDIIVSRTFTAKEGGTYTDTIKVESAEGLRYQKPQQVLDALLGEIGFDPFEFVQMDSKKQAETLLQMVPLSVDLDDMSAHDKSDFEKRRDVNRDAAQIKAQIAAIPALEVPDNIPDRNALTDELGNAANRNNEIATEQRNREQMQATIDDRKARVVQIGQNIKELQHRISQLEEEARMLEKGTAEREAELAALPPIPDFIDTDAIRIKLRDAETVHQLVEQQNRRKALVDQFDALTKQSQDFTDAMAKREAERRAALAKAKMPIEGLSIAISEKGSPEVMFNSIPFEQASTAEQLRASTAIAMAANPQLRVLRIKDGSLLDDDSMQMLAQMADAEDYQLWIEVVGTGGVGIVMENGAIRQADAVTQSESKPKAEKPAKAAAEPNKEGSLL